jgi:hypothetical protein
MIASNNIRDDRPFFIATSRPLAREHCEERWTENNNNNNNNYVDGSSGVGV